MLKINNLSKKIISLVLSIITFLLLASKINAQSILFEDNFNDDNSNGWSIVGDPGWNVQNKQYGILINNGLSNTVPEDYLWNYIWTDISYDVDILGKQGVDKNILLKFKDPLNFVEIHGNNSGLFLAKAGVGRLAYANIILANNIPYHFRFEIRNNKNIKVFLDNNIIFNVDEPTPLLNNWKIGLRAGTGGVTIAEVWFDNVVVRTLPTETPTPTPTLTSTPTPTPSPSPSPSPTLIPTPTPIPLPSLNVPDIKQFWPPWNNDIYDQATKWSSNPTIERWGCALTSAVMVLKYHGHTYTNPDILNFWLINQPDGYLSNGLLNWLAVSRYTKINQFLLSPTLEYRRLEANNNLLINELENNRPAILKEPGHFVVAKSQLPTTFGINDPGYEARTDLTPYGNNFLAIGSYRPTFTDLSYILLTVDSDKEIEVYDLLGNQIFGNTFIEEPIGDLYGALPSTFPLKIFQFPAPPNDLYTVKISGTGIYSLNSYLYDQNGQVQTASFPGILSAVQTDNFLVFVDESPQSITPPKITIDSILDDLDNSYQQRLITKKVIYFSLRNQLLTVKKLLNRKMTRIAKNHLSLIKKEIKIYTPKFIKPAASEVLLFDIKTLTDSL